MIENNPPVLSVVYADGKVAEKNGIAEEVEAEAMEEDVTPYSGSISDEVRAA